MRLEHTIETAKEIGLPFLMRCAMRIDESDGGFLSNDLVEKEARKLEGCIRVVYAFLDPSAASISRAAFAHCSPFSVNRDFMR